MFFFFFLNPKIEDVAIRENVYKLRKSLEKEECKIGWFPPNVVWCMRKIYTGIFLNNFVQLLARLKLIIGMLRAKADLWLTTLYLC